MRVAAEMVVPNFKSIGRFSLTRLLRSGISVETYPGFKRVITRYEESSGGLPPLHFILRLWLLVVSRLEVFLHIVSSRSTVHYLIMPNVVVHNSAWANQRSRCPLPLKMLSHSA
jgi:hypothetical protein